jgi:hypothetical protein
MRPFFQSPRQVRRARSGTPCCKPFAWCECALRANASTHDCGHGGVDKCKHTDFGGIVTEVGTDAHRHCERKHALATCLGQLHFPFAEALRLASGAVALRCRDFSAGARTPPHRTFRRRRFTTAQARGVCCSKQGTRTHLTSHCPSNRPQASFARCWRQGERIPGQCFASNQPARSPLRETDSIAANVT